MCQGFGIIVSKELELYFIEPDYSGDCSHTDILARLGWKENTNAHLRKFVRVEFQDWQPGSFKFDEDHTLPGWVENNKDEIQGKCVALLNKCDAALAEYEKVRYAALAEYKKVSDAALAEYKKVRAPALAELITQFSKIEGYVPERKSP